MTKPLLVVGENLAVRSFLLGLQCDCLTLNSMRLFMEGCGYPHWPPTLPVFSDAVMSKAEQQEWLRYLFSLESDKT